MNGSDETNNNSNNNRLDYVKDKLDEYVETLYDMYSEHPLQQGMTPFQHFIGALKFSGMAFASAIMLFIHALAPWWFETSGGDLLIYTSKLIEHNRSCNSHSHSHSQSSDNIVETETNINVEDEEPEVENDSEDVNNEEDVNDENEEHEDEIEENQNDNEVEKSSIITCDQC